MVGVFGFAAAAAIRRSIDGPGRIIGTERIPVTRKLLELWVVLEEGDLKSIVVAAQIIY